MEELKSEKLAPAESFISTDPRECVKIVKSANEIFPRELITVPELFSKTVADYGDHPALMYKKEGNSDEWTPITYREYKNRTEQVAKAFIKLGLEEHGSVCVLANNSVEWLVSFLAAIHAGGQIVGIYTTNSADAAFYILDSCRANIVVVDTDDQLEKILKVRENLPHLKAIVKIHPSYAKGVWKWSDLEEMPTTDVEDEYQRRLARITANAFCCLVFTSGTTGNPKGAMISHDNAMWNIENVINTFGPFEMGRHTFVSYLPLSHIAAPFVDIFLSLSLAATVYFADKNALKGSLMRTLVEVRPTFFFGVPRIFEKIHEKLLETINGGGKGLKRSLVLWAQSTALSYHKERIAGRNPFPLPYMIAKYFVLSGIKAALGLDGTESLITGSAPTSTETLEFFLSLDLPLLEAYGMTESSGVSFGNSPRDMKIGSVGKCFKGIEVKIENPNAEGCGEICTRGRSTFMGYMNDPEKTRAAIDADGWLHSGDVGFIDSEGFLHMTGRIKELIITAGGENIPFLHIEELVRSECKAISNTFLVGDKRKFLSMLITLKTEMNVEGAPCDELAPESIDLMRDLGLKYTLLSEVLIAGPDPKVMAELQAAVDRANKKAISNAQKVQKFSILPNDFSLATGELNATMKLKRNYLLIKYKDVIDRMYS